MRTKQMCNISRNMWEARTSHGWSGVKKKYLQQIQIIFSPGKPRALFFGEKDMLIADLQNGFRYYLKLRIEQLTLQYIIAEIQQFVGSWSFSSSDQFGLPSGYTNLPPLLSQTEKEHSIERFQKAGKGISNFNNKWHKFFNKLVRSLLSETSITNVNAVPAPPHSNRLCLIFDDALGGIRRTFINLALLWYSKLNVRRVLAVLSSVVAAQRLDGRHTAHSAFKIPVHLHHQSVCSIDVNSTLTDELCNSSLFIWHAILMRRHHNAGAVNQTF